jgi:hypothetical protein
VLQLISMILNRIPKFNKTVQVALKTKKPLKSTFFYLTVKLNLILTLNEIKIKEPVILLTPNLFPRIKT